MDNTDELVMLLGAAALSCGNGGVLAFEDIFGGGVWDSNDDELIPLDVTGIWVVLEIIVRWFVAFEDIFGCGVLVNIDGLIWDGLFWDCANVIDGPIP